MPALPTVRDALQLPCSFPPEALAAQALPRLEPAAYAVVALAGRLVGLASREALAELAARGGRVREAAQPARAVAADADLRGVAAFLARGPERALAVVSEQRRLLGVVTLEGARAALAAVAPPLAAWVADLSSPEPGRREAARQGLAAHPRPSGLRLAATLRAAGSPPVRALAEVPAPESLGPAGPMLLALGAEVAAPAVATLLQSPEAGGRYAGVVLAAHLGTPELLAPLAGAALDLEPAVAGAARLALARLRTSPAFEPEVLAPLRQALGSPSSALRAGAAQALGALRDPGAVPALIPQVADRSAWAAREAREALLLITKQTLGPRPRAWWAWWRRRGGLGRRCWLVEGLAHRDLQVRLSAIGELLEEANDSFGFVANGPAPERARAIAAWERWLVGRMVA